MGTSEAITKAATRLFRTKGYHGTTVEDIARAVGQKKGSLYYHISGKEELLMGILNDAMTNAVKRIENIMKLRVPPMERLRRAVEDHIAGVLTHRDAVTVFLQEGDKLTGQSNKRYLSKRREYEKAFRLLVQSAMKHGGIRKGDVSLLTRAILGTCNSVLVWYRPGGRLRPGEIAASLADFIFNGILPRP